MKTCHMYILSACAYVHSTSIRKYNESHINLRTQANSLLQMRLYVNQVTINHSLFVWLLYCLLMAVVCGSLMLAGLVLGKYTLSVHIALAAQAHMLGHRILISAGDSNGSMATVLPMNGSRVW